MKMHQSSIKELSLEDGKCKNASQTPTNDDEDEDDIISQAIGKFGRWQLRLTILLALFNMPCTWHIFAPTFHALPRKFWCGRPANLIDVPIDIWINRSQPLNPCSIYNLNWNEFTVKDIIDGNISTQNANLQTCTNWEFEGDPVSQTIISQWNLVCDNEQLINVAEMMFLAGVAIGGLVSGIISDHYGRKKTLMASVTIQTVLGTTIAFCPWFELYLILRACLGFCSVSVVFSGFVLLLEIVGGRWRPIVGISYLFPVPLSYIVIAYFGWLLRDWRDLQLMISLPSILFLGLYWVLPESPRWLLAMGQKTKLIAILHEAAAVNKMEIPDNIEKHFEVPMIPQQSECGESVGIKDLFRTVQMRKNVFLLFIIWFSVYLVYYGLVLNISNIGGDLYINTVLSGVVELPSIAASILIIHRGGRRWPLCLTLALAGCACLLTLIVPYIPTTSSINVQWLKTAFAHAGKFSVSSSNAVMPVFTAELFPTVIRNLGVGASNVSAGIALMLVPYLWNLSKMADCVPMGVLGVCGVIGGICVLFLPETGNKPLSDTFETPTSSPIPSPLANEKKQEETFTLPTQGVITDQVLT